jgi:hypothetical protein
MERRALRRGPIVRVVIVMFVSIAVAGCGGGGSSGDGGGKELSARDARYVTGLRKFTRTMESAVRSAANGDVGSAIAHLQACSLEMASDVGGASPSFLRACRANAWVLWASVRECPLTSA